MAQKEISYKFVEPIGVLDTQKEGWNRETHAIARLHHLNNPRHERDDSR